MPRPVARAVLSALAGVLLLTGCGSSNLQRAPEAPNEGVQATGVIGGQRIAISDGNADTNLVDCDPEDGPDRDVCWIARTIDGRTITMIIENPDALVPGETITVATDSCSTCDDVRDHAVVDLRVGDDRQRASSGRLVVSEAGPRYAARFSLRFPSGDHLNGDFNIRQFAPMER